MSRIASAQTYPARQVRIMVGFAAGGTADILARLMGQWLSEHLGQPFLIENRTGGGSNIATEAVVRAPPDGHTLLLVAGAQTVNATLYDKLSFNFIHDIAPVASISRQTSVLVVNPLFPAKSIADFIAYTKANPGKINMASAGIGSPSHVAGEMFKMMTGVNIVHVPYRGGAPALTDLLGGQVQIYFSQMAGTIEYIRAGTLRPLAVISAARSEALPDVPTVGEFVPGYEASSVWGLGAPRNTSPDIVEKLNKEINAALSDTKMKARLGDLGGTVLPGTPADFGQLIAEETEKWAKVIRAANIRPEWAPAATGIP
jgi:tripartite-type tricarboxylate transporter receptor subunit TctC